MHDPTSDATAILDVMESDRTYEATELLGLFPDISLDTLRAAMHTLWIKRLVERAGMTGWRRQQSTCGTAAPPDPKSCVTCRLARTCARCVRDRPVKPVRPGELFGESAFSGMFK
jgi:hypothetical protein